MAVKVNILRLSLTLPRENFPGAGLQPFYCRRFSRYKSINITRYSQSKLLNSVYEDGRGNIIEIPFYHFAFRDGNANLLILIYKLIWAVIAFFYIFLIILKKSIKFDIIHCHSIHFLPAGLILKFIFNKPLFLSVGGSEVKRLNKFPLLANISNSIDCIFFVAEAMRPKLEKCFPRSRIIHIGNGVDKKLFFESQGVRKNTIISVGNIRWQKGYDILLKAIENCENKYELKVIGSYDNDYFRKKITPLMSPMTGVAFIGPRSQQEINELFNQSKLFVLSSISEGFPKVIIEAMSAGLPVVATDVGDVKKVVGEAGIVVEPNNPKELSNAIETLMNDTKLWNKCRLAALKKSSNYSWEAVVSKIDENYQSIRDLK